MQYYNINDYVKFGLEGHRNFSNSFRYNNYHSEEIELKKLDFIVKIGEFTPNLDRCAILDDTYFIREGYLYIKNDSYKLIKWEMEIVLSPETPILIKINFKNWLTIGKIPYIIIEGVIIDPLIHFILIKKHNALIHASCVSDENNEAVLFISRGGAGKTTISTKLVSNGYTLVSDNFSIITPEKQVVGFHEPLNIFSYNVNAVILRSLSLRYRTEIFLKDIIYRLTTGYVKIFTRINPKLIFNINQNSIKMKSAFLMIPNSSLESDIILKKIPASQMIDHIYFNQKLEFPYFDKYCMVYSYQFPDSALARHWEDYKKSLASCLPNQLYHLEIPTKLSKSTIEKIIEVIHDG